MLQAVFSEPFSRNLEDKLAEKSGDNENLAYEFSENTDSIRNWATDNVCDIWQVIWLNHVHVLGT